MPEEEPPLAYVKHVVLLIGRLLLALIFLHEGFVLAANFDAAAAAMAKLGVGMPTALAVVALQIAAGLSLALGIFARLGALLLGLFCIATATLFHTDFSSHDELLHFEKDLAIAGGMLVLAAAGSGAWSLDRLWDGGGLVAATRLTQQDR